MTDNNASTLACGKLALALEGTSYAKYLETVTAKLDDLLAEIAALRAELAEVRHGRESAGGNP